MRAAAVSSDAAAGAAEALVGLGCLEGCTAGAAGSGMDRDSSKASMQGLNGWSVGGIAQDF
jgi:hypothetical protein